MRLRTPLMMLALACLAALGAIWPADAAAQRRVGRGRVARPVRSVVLVARPYYYLPWYYYPRPFFWSWYGQYPVGPYPPYYGRPRLYDNSGSARLQVRPRNTEVYVDGYFVGTADDFDGFLQRLHVPAGEHELQLYLEGYRPLSQRVLFRPGATLKIIHTMEPLATGTANEPRPQPDENPRTAGRRGVSQARPPNRPDERSAFGTLSLRVQPADALVLVDGQRWEGSPEADRLIIELADGAHRIELRKEGYRTYLGNIQVRRGQTVTLNVSLTHE